MFSANTVPRPSGAIRRSRPMLSSAYRSVPNRPPGGEANGARDPRQTTDEGCDLTRRIDAPDVAVRGVGHVHEVAEGAAGTERDVEGVGIVEPRPSLGNDGALSRRGDAVQQ